MTIVKNPGNKALEKSDELASEGEPVSHDYLQNFLSSKVCSPNLEL